MTSSQNIQGDSSARSGEGSTVSAEDAAKYRMLMRWLHNGRIPGPGHGRPIKLVEVDPMYGEECQILGLELDALLSAALSKAGEQA